MAVSKANSKVAAVVLAAGGSLRMGSLKQQLPWKDSDLIGHAVHQALKSEADHVFVVLGAQSNTLRTAMEREAGVQVIENREWQRGMGTSVALAARFIIEEYPETQAILFLVVDQPLMHYKHLNKLINKYLTNISKIVSSRYQGILGVPSLFGRPFCGELQKLQGDQGAKSILLRHPEAIIAVECGSLCQDVDTREAYEALWRVKGQNESE